MDRDTLKNNFLDSNKLGASKRIALKKDASHRVYERIIKEDGGSFVLMDAPPEKEKVEPFIHVANLLLQNDFSAPKIITQDVENGFLLLEDFGDDSFTNILSGKSKLSGEIEEVQIYERAVDNLIRLHKLPTNSAGLANYDEGMLIKESMRFVQFYLEVLNCERIDKVVQEEYVIIFKHLISIAKNFANVIVLRDYHADNLMWLDDRLGYRKVGLLDFQDAVIGSPVYDLVSLLEDARRDVSPQLVDKMIKRYLQAFPNLSQKEFAATYAIYAVQRNLKIVGVFARLATTHKNPYYLTLLPRVWRHINNDLKHPLLLPLKKWLIKRVPMQMKY